MGERLKIDILTLHSPDDARVFGRHARGLARSGHRVRLLAPGTEAATRDGVEIIPVPRSRNRLTNFTLTPLSILARVLRGRPHVAYLHDVPLLYLMPVLRLAGIRCVYDVHEDYGNMLRHRDWIPIRLRNLVGASVDVYERAMSRFAFAIVVATAPLLDKFPHKNKVAVYNLPAADVIEAGLAQTLPSALREWDVVHLGTFNQRRLEFFRRVLDRLFAVRPDTRVLIIGASPDQVADWQSHFPVDRVLVIPRLPHAEVASYLGRCRVGVSVHPWLTPHLALAVPVKLFEYMACGCAIVTSHMPEFERLLHPEDRASLAVVGGEDVDGWVRAIEAWLDRPERADAAALTLRAHLANRYSWRAEEPKLLEMFQRVLDGVGRRV